jgi:predicted acetyltransferase
MLLHPLENQVSSVRDPRTILVMDFAIDFEIRPITADEWDRYWSVLEAAFGESMSDDERDEFRGRCELDRTRVAFDRDRIVGTASAYSMELTLPGLTTIPVGGLTDVSVLPTYRRRGILRALVERHLEDVESRGEPVSVLNASESAIYGRFGYGVATMSAEYEISTRYAAFRSPPEAPGRVRMLDASECEKVLPSLYDRVRHLRPGELSRNAGHWAGYLRDGEWRRQGGSRHFDVVYEETPDQVDGWVGYRFDSNWSDGLPGNCVVIRELHTLTPTALAALVRFCLDLDLAAAVRLRPRPIDEPLRWLLADPRRLLTTRVRDDLWVRLLDLPAALTARGYADEGRLVLQVTDALRPRNQGRFVLEAGPGGASLRPTGAAPDLAMDVSDLGAAYLGGVRFTTLAQAGRVAERTPGALRGADRMFTVDPAPLSTTYF